LTAIDPTGQRGGNSGANVGLDLSAMRS
jgi:hypothetical protein